jgi:hypothetical protein
MLYNLGLTHKDDRLTIFNNQTMMGAIAMTSVMFG